MRRVLIVPIAVAILGSFAACGSSPQPVGRGQVQAAGVVLPSQVLGLSVAPEDVEKLFGEARRPFIESIGLFSMREDDLVRATMQIGKFNRAARPSNSEFRQAIIGRIGTSRPQQIVVGDTTVWVSSGTDQVIFVWFKKRGFYVLTTHGDYEFPRTLLRRMITLEQDF